MRSRILFAPEFTTEPEVRDALTRAVFHLAHIDVESLTLIVPPVMVSQVENLVRDGFEPGPLIDPVVPARLAQMRDVIQVAAAGGDREALSLGADVILAWHSERFEESDWVVERTRRQLGLELFDVDHVNNRMESSAYALLMSKLEDADPNAERRRFERHFGSGQTWARAYLFGSGPSIAEAHDIEFGSGLKVVCNTVILDEELMDRLEPDVLTFADPIFHFGPSVYGANFRTALQRFAARHPTAIVVPLKYRGLLVSLCPGLEDRIIGVPFLGATAGPNLDLTDVFAVKPIPNVLTLLMLPVAATLAEHLFLVGFDGRAPDEDYFWKHGEKTQLHDDMEDIKLVHPGFFNLDYEEYFDDHSRVLESLVMSIEETGRTVQALTPSYVPALRRRPADRPPLPVLPDIDADTILVGIEPDWLDAFGHHGYWFEGLRAEAAARGAGVLALCSAGRYPQSPAEVPVFSHPSWAKRGAGLYAESFAAELCAAVDHVRTAYPDKRLVFSAYSLDVWHLSGVFRAAAAGRGEFIVNLMRIHPEVLDALGDRDGARAPISRMLGLAARVAGRLGVTLTVDTDELAEAIETLTGWRPPTWPMVAVSEIATRSHDGSHPTIYAPVQSQETKGILETATAFMNLARSEGVPGAGYAMRAVTQPLGTSRKIRGALEHAERSGVELVKGDLPAAEYSRRIADSDLVVVPYRVHPFRTRTSAVVLDALRHGVPVVLSRGTWAANLAEEYEVCVTFQSGDPADLERAIIEAGHRLDQLGSAARRAQPAVLDRFHMRHLATFLLDGAREVRRTEDVDDLLEAFDTAVSLAYTARTTSVSTDDLDVRRRLNRASARIGELNRAIEHRDRKLAEIRPPEAPLSGRRSRSGFEQALRRVVKKVLRR